MLTLDHGDDLSRQMINTNHSINQSVVLNRFTMSVS